MSLFFDEIEVDLGKGKVIQFTIHPEGAPYFLAFGDMTDPIALCHLVGRVGLEPTRDGLKARCSATELPARRLGCLAIGPPLVPGATSQLRGQGTPPSYQRRLRRRGGLGMEAQATGRRG